MQRDRTTDRILIYPVGEVLERTLLERSRQYNTGLGADRYIGEGVTLVLPGPDFEPRGARRETLRDDDIDLGNACR